MSYSGTSGTEPATLSDFSRFGLRPELERAVAAAGYEVPRPIQSRTIPAALAGRDVLGLAQTGTGKTVAFGLPVLERLLARPEQRPRVLVVAPTRELVLQIDGELRKLARFTSWSKSSTASVVATANPAHRFRSRNSTSGTPWAFPSRRNR